MDLLVDEFGKPSSMLLGFFELGRAAMFSESFEEAIRYFDLALEQRSDSNLENEKSLHRWQIYYLKGQSLASNVHKLDEAIIIFLRAALEESTDIELLLRKTTQYISQDIAPAVMQWCNDTNWWGRVKLPPEGDKVDLLLSVFRMKLLYLLGDIEKAKALFVESNKRFKNNDQASFKLNYQLTKLVFESSNFDYVPELFLTTSASKLEDQEYLDNQWDYWLLRIKIELRRNNWKEAFSLVEKLDQTNRVVPFDKQELRLVMIDLYLANQEFDKAQEISSFLSDDIELEQTKLIWRAQLLIEGQIAIREGIQLLLRAREKGGKIDEHIEYLVGGRPESPNTLLFILLAKVRCHHQLDLEEIEKLLEQIKQMGLLPNSSTKGPDRYPEIGISVAEGEIQFAKHEYVPATESFSLAGRYYNWAGNREQAIIYFDQALELTEQHTVTRWYYMDLLLRRSYIQELPYQDEALLEQAYKMWHESAVRDINESSDYWVYSTAARIHEERFRFTPEEAREELWNALLYSERATYWRSNETYPLVDLARHLRYLHLERNALWVIESFASDNKDLYAVEQAITVYLDNYQWEKADNCFRILGEINPDHLYENWKGFSLFMQFKMSEALAFFLQAKERNPQDIWTLRALLNTYVHLGEWEDGQSIAREILDYKNQISYEREFGAFVWAYLVLGNYVEALAMEQLSRKVIGKTSAPSSNEAIVLLLNGRIDLAQEHFKIYLELAQKRKESISLRLDLQKKQKLAKMLSKQKQLTAEQEGEIFHILDEWKRQIELALQEIGEYEEFGLLKEFDKDRLLDSCFVELKTEMELYNLEKGSIPWIALQSTQARLLGEAGRYIESLELYQTLSKYPHFPEARYVSEQKGKSWYIDCFQSQDYPKALMILEYLHDFATMDKRNTVTAELYRCLTLSRLERMDQAQQVFTLALYQSIDLERNFVLDQLINILSKSEDINLWSDVEVLLNKVPEAAKEIVTPLSEALLQLRPSYWTSILNGDKISTFANAEGDDISISQSLIPVVLGKLVPTAERIEIECHPEDESSNLVEGLVARLRAGIEETYGLRLQSLRGQNKWEVPRGTLRLFYAGKLIGSRKLAEDSTYTAVYELLYSMIVEHLPDFHTLDMTIQVLNNTIVRAEAGKNQFSDPNTIVDFHLLLKNMLKERLPITSILQLWEAFWAKKQLGANENECFVAMRLKCRSKIMEQIQGLQPIRVPETIEKSILKHVLKSADKEVVVLPKKTYRTVKKSLVDLLAGDSPEAVFLITSNTQGRAFIRNVIARDWPQIPVVAATEIAETDQ